MLIQMGRHTRLYLFIYLVRSQHVVAGQQPTAAETLPPTPYTAPHLLKAVVFVDDPN